LLANRDGADTLKNVEFLQLKDAIYDVVNDVDILNQPPVTKGLCRGQLPI
jgi:hypothetical protein